MIIGIASVDKNWGIGFNNNLLEHIPNDMKLFKSITVGNVVIMGRKTYDSLPKKPLIDRLNIVITKNKEEKKEDNNVIYMTFEESLNWIYKNEKKYNKIFIIGGESIYNNFLLLCDNFYITKIYKEHNKVDSYLSNLDNDDHWNGKPISEIENYNNIPYQFWHYSRIY